MADDLVLHKEEVREYLSRLAGVCQILESIPAFLKGDNDHGHSIRLTKAELGGYEKFYSSWGELCDDRMREAQRIAHFMRANRQKLVRAASKVVGADMDAAASFPPTLDHQTGEGESLEDAVEKHGMDVENRTEAARREHPNIPE